MSIHSPKQAFTWAIEMGWIPREEEPLWRQIIEDRNLTTHTYREALAATVAARILETHANAFANLLERMKTANT